jgi:hypothetical protein
MKHLLRFGTLCGLLAALFALSGCMTSETVAPRQATGVWGYVASSKNATIAVDPAKSTIVSVVASRVVAPANCLLVATASGTGTGTAMQLGVVPVKSGETTSLTIPIMGVRTSAITLTMFLDRGRVGEFEFDPMNPTSSPDRPIFVGGRPVEVTVTVSAAAAPTGSGNAVLDVFDQPAAATLNVTHVVTPGPSWLIVYADENGAPGRELGRLALAATDSIGIGIPLYKKPAPGGVFVALHADEGVVGTFERPSSTGATTTPGGTDILYVVGGSQVMKRIALR